jgi:hypothetical protein
MTDTKGEFSSLWQSAEKTLRDREANVEAEEAIQRDFLNRFRTTANRVILPILARAAKDAQGTCYVVKTHNGTARGEVRLDAARPGTVAAVYPGHQSREPLESRLSFTADPERRLVVLSISGHDIGEEAEDSYELDSVVDGLVRNWVEKFIEALDPEPVP